MPEKKGQCDLLPVDHGIRYDEPAWQKKGQCDSQAVGHGIRCDEPAWQKKCSVAHKLLVIG